MKMKRLLVSLLIATLVSNLWYGLGAPQPAAAQSSLAEIGAAATSALSSTQPDQTGQAAPTATCQVTTNADSGAGSLREKLADPNCNPINFAGDYTIRLMSELVISRLVTVDGSGHAVTVSGDTDGDGVGQVRSFHVAGSGVGTLTQINIIDSAAGVGGPGYTGGGISVEAGGVLIVQNSAFTGNSASSPDETYSYGGAIYNTGTLTVTNSTFSDNSATSSGAAWGGAIYNGTGGAATVINSTFSSNTTASGEIYINAGGAIANQEGMLTVTGSTFSGNFNSDSGGAISSNVGTVILTNDIFDGNSSRWGGGLDVYWGASVSIQGCTFSNNTAAYSAGAIALQEGTLTITHSTFENNTSAYSGGAIWAAYAGTLAVENSTFDNNTATNGSGGGIYSGMDMTTAVLTSTFSANTAGGSWGNGGAIDSNDSLTVESSTFYSNTSGSWGGAITLEDGTGWLTNNTISGNSAGYLGGGIVTRGVLTVTNNTIVGNSAPSEAGGVLLYMGTLNLQNTIIAGSSGAPDCGNPWGGTMATNINNLVEDGSCSAGAVGFVTGDPKLGPLMNNGGSTDTHMPMPHSLAVDAGDDATCAALDQRGVSRPQNMHCDIGAVEAPIRPVIRLNKSVTPDTDLPANSVVTYTLVLRNTGSLDDPNVLLTDTLPTEVDFKQWIEQPAGAVESGNQITWVGPVTNGNIITYTFQATQTAGLGETVINTAEFSGTAAADNASAAFGVECGPTYLVTNDLDSGPGSLRNGIMAVCAGGTITFDSDYTIHLASPLGGATGIGKAVTVDGSGHAITISGDTGPAPDGVPDVGAIHIAASGTVILNHLTIRDASTTAFLYGIYGMGAIYNQGSLTVQNCTIFGNRNIAEYAYGAGISSFGSLTVQNSTFYDNLASGSVSYGAGLYGTNSLVENSTFYDNVAIGTDTAYGGGIANGYNLRLVNSTIYSNSVSITSTQSGGGGLANLGYLDYYNNIVAGGTGADCLNMTDWGAAINDNINNLVEDGTCSTNGVNFLAGDPRLGTLADNGGDTFTVMLLPDSPAIDAGDATTCPAADQRDQARNDWQCDIGALELQLTDSTIVHQTVTGPGPQTFGPTLVKMDFAESGELITATVEYHPGPYTYTIGLPDGFGVGWGPYYTITGLGSSGAITTGVSLTLTLPTGGISVPYVCKYIGQDWDCAVDGNNADFAWRNGVTSFSDWTVGDYSNTAPILDASGDPYLVPVAEDQVIITGTRVMDMLATGANGDPITDPDPGAVDGIAITAADSMHGAWQYSLDGTTWINLMSPSESAAILLASDITTTLRFLPDANYNGSVSLTFRAWDQTSGSNGGVADTTVNGGETAFSMAQETATQTVNPINDVPVVDAGPDQSAIEGSLLTFAGSFNDPGLMGSPQAGETILWNFGDGEIISGTLNPTHTYTDDGVYTVTLSVTDTLGGVGYDTLLVTIANAAPVLGALEDQTVLQDTELIISVVYTDAGSLDTHTAQIDWGDGNVTNGVVNALNHQVGGNHIYQSPGTYTLILTITDDDGGIDTLTVQVTVTPSDYKIFLPIIRR